MESKLHFRDEKYVPIVTLEEQTVDSEETKLARRAKSLKKQTLFQGVLLLGRRI